MQPTRIALERSRRCDVAARERRHTRHPTPAHLSAIDKRCSRTLSCRASARARDNALVSLDGVSGGVLDSDDVDDVSTACAVLLAVAVVAGMVAVRAGDSGGDASAAADVSATSVRSCSTNTPLDAVPLVADAFDVAATGAATACKGRS
jgi:hypothetical protein